MSNYTYTESWELAKLARDLVDRYQFYLPTVDLEQIYFVEKGNGKPKPKKQRVCKIFGLNGSSLKELAFQQTKKLYALEVWVNEWAQLTTVEKQWFVFNELLSVGREGKLKKPDILEFGYIVELLGPYWRKPSNAGLLPDMLSGDPVPIPLPPDDEEEEDGTLDEEE